MITILAQSIALVTHGRRSLTSLLVFGTVIQGCFPVLVLWIGKTVLDIVVDRNAAPSDTFNGASPILVLLLAATATSAAVAQVTRAVSVLLGDLVTQEVNLKVINHATSLDLAHFENAEFMDRLQRAQQEAGARPVAVLTDLAQLLQSGVGLIAMSVVMLKFHWAAPLLPLLCCTPQVLFEIRFAGTEHLRQWLATPTCRQMRYFCHVLTSVECFKEVKLFGLAPLLVARYERLFARVQADRESLAKRNVGVGILTSTVVASGYAVFYAFAVHRTLHGDLTVGSLTLYAGAYSQIQAELGGLVRRLAGLYQHGLFIDNLFEFLNLRPLLVSPLKPVPIPRKHHRGIELRHVSFRYSPNQRWTLDDVTTTIAPGERVVLVGENGAGKTTLVKLICRFYDPAAGQILFEGVDLRDLDRGQYWDLMGVAFQESARYQLSASENIGVGRVAAIADQDRIVRAAAASGADAIVRALPEGYDSTLGTYFGNGRELSGGEWQLIGIARVFMRGGEIVILDEPTASLDPVRECEALSRIDELTRGRMSVIVSHRLSTAVTADRIIVLERGRIVEEGTHRELLRRDGTYARLFALQASRYQRT